MSQVSPSSQTDWPADRAAPSVMVPSVLIVIWAPEPEVRQIEMAVVAGRWVTSAMVPTTAPAATDPDAVRVPRSRPASPPRSKRLADCLVPWPMDGPGVSATNAVGAAAPPPPPAAVTHVPGVPATVQRWTAPAASSTTSPVTHEPVVGAPEPVFWPRKLTAVRLLYDPPARTPRSPDRTR